MKWPVPFGDGRVDVGLVLDVRPLIPYFDDEVAYYVPQEYLIRWTDGDEEWCSEEDNLIVVSPR